MNMKRNLTRGMLGLVLGAACAPALAGDWANWRGPEQNGVSREQNLPATWDPFSGENLAWRNDKVTGMSSPVVMNGKLYTWTRVGEEKFGEGDRATIVVGPKTAEALVAVDIATGKIVWEYKVNMSQTDVPFHRLGWGNVVADPQTGRVYGYGTQGHLVCLDGQTGKRVWYRQMLEEFGQISTFGGRTQSPTVDEDQLLFGGVAFGWGDNAQGQHRLFAFDKATGELRWTSNTGGRPVDAPYGTPVVTVVNGVRTAIICAGDGGVYGFKARTGEKLWGYQLSKRGTNSTPLVVGDRVIACSSEESSDTSTMGRVACLDLTQIDPAKKTIKEVWRLDALEAGFPSPTTDGKSVFVMDNSGKVHALDVKTGKKQWDQKVGTMAKASLVYGDGKLYAADAKTFAIIEPPEAGKKRAKVLSKVELEADAQTLGREYYIFGSPAISDGRLYLQTAGGTYCIGPKEVVKQDVKPAELAKEEPADKGAAPAVVQVVPADALVRAGEKATFKVRTFDDKGRLLAENVKAEWAIDQLVIPPPPARPGTPPPAAPPQVVKAGNLKGKVEGGEFTSENGPPQGGAVVATVDAGGTKVTGKARVRVVPALPWKFDFEAAPTDKPPLTWLNAGGKFKVIEQPGEDGKPNKVLVKTLDIDLYHAARTFFGDTHRSDYTIEADVMTGFKEAGGRKNIPDVGVVANKYGLHLMGNHQQLVITPWTGALPKEGQAGAALYRAIPYAWVPEKWYRLKLSVLTTDGKAQIRGKVWPRGESEPDKWMIELVDDQPNTEGSPGLYGESLVTPIKSEIYYDNVVVSPAAP
ncbi:MAG TPA: PQQ-binding-like beta-propeller repeat protein [Tepidisphaeraceae bacterium]|nr:PQQ-binding-like beta-propeller repeat protein [Tepidisphaeraceae bacterium]